MTANNNNNQKPNIQQSQHDSSFLQRSKHWIIVVDDEEPIRTAVSQYLFDSGYQVTSCADADTALDIIHRGGGGGSSSNNNKTPDLIVSDIRMPGTDGLQFLQTIRSDPTLISIPVVLLTAKGLTRDRIDGFNAGADAYLPKPFDPEELVSIIDKSIRRRDDWNGENVAVVQDMKKDLDEIKNLLLMEGGGGVDGWVEATNVFLTVKEREVLELLCGGLMNKEIAEELFISKRRVEQHLTSMFRKTGCVNRTELVRWAVSTGNVQL